MERVDCFKYLGLTFSKNGKYTKAIKSNLEKGQRAAFSIMKKVKHLQLSVSCTLHLINTVVKPILLYGCEVYCFDNTTSLEKFYPGLNTNFYTHLPHRASRV